MLSDRDGYGCPTCGPDVYCRDDAGEDYGPDPSDNDNDNDIGGDPWLLVAEGAAVYDEEPF